MPEADKTWLKKSNIFGIALASFLIASSGYAPATTKAEAISLCIDALQSDYGASDIHYLEFRSRDDRPYVYGDASTTTADTVHFRCIVFDEKVRSVDYLVPQSEQWKGHIWVRAPHGSPIGSIAVDSPEGEPDKEPLHPTEPHFMRVNQ